METYKVEVPAVRAIFTVLAPSKIHACSMATATAKRNAWRKIGATEFSDRESESAAVARFQRTQFLAATVEP